MSEARSEKVFLQNGDTLVTNSRINLNGTTYVTANITSVSRFTVVPSRKIEIIAGLVGVLLLAGGVFLPAIFVIGVAALIFYLRKNKHIVKLSSNAGEKDALWSTDKAFIDSVVESINNAIIYRG
jgi:hypothetical protein